jgi:choline kinase
MRAVILAAGAGRRLKEAFEDPKCLIPVCGTPLLGRTLEALEAAGIQEVVLVLGYRMEKVVRYLEALCPGLRVHRVHNADFARGSVLSLWAAREWLRGNILLMDGDLFFGRDFLRGPLGSKKRNFFFLDPAASNDGEAVMVGFRQGKAVSLARGLRGDFEVCGEWAGALRLSPEGSSLLREIVGQEIAAGRLDEGYEFVVPRLFDALEVSYEAIDTAGWLEIDFPADMQRAERLCRKMEERRGEGCARQPD